jgi:hypothetical protein
VQADLTAAQPGSYSKVIRSSFPETVLPHSPRTGIEFIDENGGGPGVRLRDRQEPK